MQENARKNKLGIWEKPADPNVVFDSQEKAMKTRIVVAKKEVSSHPVVAEKKTMLFHEPQCRKVRRKPKHELELFPYPYKAYQNNYTPCSKCFNKKK